jgi:hypothetical protein
MAFRPPFRLIFPHARPRYRACSSPGRLLPFVHCKDAQIQRSLRELLLRDFYSETVDLNIDAIRALYVAVRRGIGFRRIMNSEIKLQGGNKWDLNFYQILRKHQTA